MACGWGTARTQRRGSGGTPAGTHQTSGSDAREGALRQPVPAPGRGALLWAYGQLEEGKPREWTGSAWTSTKRLEGRLASIWADCIEELTVHNRVDDAGFRRAMAGAAPGIPTIEDKIVQRGLAALLTEVYEEEFCNFSYGFRPGRGCHTALRGLARHIAHNRVNWIVEADIKGFFDAVDHEWLLRMLARVCPTSGCFD